MKSSNMTPGRMKALFDERGIVLSKIEAQNFYRLFELLVQYNDEYDLTRIKSPEDIIIKHFIDSIYILNLMDLPSPLLDIGTGAGFPGIPIKIMKPEISMILAEPRHKRVKFMEMVIKELGLENVEIYPHLVTEKSFFSVQGVITRALENMDETLSRAAHFLPEGGRVIFMKGQSLEGDRDSISSGNAELYNLALDKEYTLPLTDYRRELLAYEKRVSSVKRTYRIFVNTNETLGMPITSPDNKKFKLLKKLLTTRGIKEQNKTIVSGSKIIMELMKDDLLPKEDLFIYDGYSEDDMGILEIINRFHASGNLFILKKSLYSELDTFNTGKPLMTVPVPEIREWDMEPAEGLNLLIPFQDPVNVGTVTRSAAGFSVKKIILMREASNPYHPKSIRASGGAVFKTAFEKGPSIEELKNILADRNIPLVALDKKGVNITDYKFPEKFLLLPGVEGPGIPEELRGNMISIPIDGSINSYNAAIAATIALYEWHRRKDQ